MADVAPSAVSSITEDEARQLQEANEAAWTPVASVTGFAFVGRFVS